MGKKEKFSYFDLFEKQAAAAVLEAELLLEVIDNYGSKDAVADAMERAHTLENESDKYAHAVYQRLAHDFITPIERDDIIELTQALDNLIDYIEDVVLCFHMYPVLDMHEHARSSRSSSRKLQGAREGDERLPQLQEVQDVPRAHHRREHVRRAGRPPVHQGESPSERRKRRVDPLTTAMWWRIFDRMEKCCDACEHVADTMGGILLKNA